MNFVVFVLLYPLVLASGMLADVILSFQYDAPIPTMREQLVAARDYTRNFVNGDA